MDPGYFSTDYSYNDYQLRNLTLNLTIKNVNVIMDSGALSISQLTRNGELTNIISEGVSSIIDRYCQVVLNTTEHDEL